MQRAIFCFLALAANFVGVGTAEEKEPAGAPGEVTPGETKRVGWASAPPVRQNTYRAGRMKNKPTIDADWNSPAWKDVTPLVLEYYMGQEPVHQPKTQAKVAYDDQFLFLIWKVEDRYVLARRTKHRQDVWRDSCVEIFFTPGGDPTERGYFNLESNCTGVKLLGTNVSGGKGKNVTEEDFAGIVTASSLKGPIDPELKEPTTWTLEYRIPLSLLEKFTPIERPRPGVTWRANFYKCAEDVSHPHWLTWSPVTNPKPSFHLPKYFGVLEFE